MLTPLKLMRAHYSNRIDNQNRGKHHPTHNMHMKPTWLRAQKDDGASIIVGNCLCLYCLAVLSLCYNQSIRYIFQS